MACSYCGGVYGLGPAQGTLFISYPQAEYRYWHHCLTEQHVAILHQMTAIQTEQLKQFEASLAAGKAHQQELRDPTRIALKSLLA